MSVASYSAVDCNHIYREKTLISLLQFCHYMLRPFDKKSMLILHRFLSRQLSREFANGQIFMKFDIGVEFITDGPPLIKVFSTKWHKWRISLWLCKIIWFKFMLATAFLPQVVGSGAAPGASYHRDIDIVTQEIKQQVTLCVFYMRFFYLIFYPASENIFFYWAKIKKSIKNLKKRNTTFLQKLEGESLCLKHA